MNLARSLRRSLTWAIYCRRFGRAWANLLADNAIWPLEGARRDGAGLFLEGLGITLSKPDRVAAWVLHGRHFSFGLHQRAGANFELTQDGVLITVDGIRLAAHCEADLGILSEIFVERIYTFESPGPFLVVDIGANIGAAALFFARHYGAAVEAYELVPSTADIAEANIALNPGLARAQADIGGTPMLRSSEAPAGLEAHDTARIRLHRFGLADKDMEIDIPVSEEFRPSNSIYAPMNGPTEKVQVRDAAVVLADVIRDLGDRKLVLKIDAEGAEYEIVRRLSSEGLLGRAEIVFIEWHEREGCDPFEIRDALRSAGFRWFERVHGEVRVGMITAFR